MQPESNLMTDVVVNDIFGAEFEYSDSKFVKTYQDIGNAEDFYSFLKGPVSTLMFSAQDNYLHVIPVTSTSFTDCSTRGFTLLAIASACAITCIVQITNLGFSLFVVLNLMT